MAKVKKSVKKAQGGTRVGNMLRSIKKVCVGDQCDWSSDRGGGVSRGSGRSPRTEEYKPPRRVRQDDDNDTPPTTRRGEMIKVAAKKLPPMSTAPGVRPSEKAGEYKKGSQSFFGGDKDPNEARYGKKMAKKAKAGAKIKKAASKIVKSIKKSTKKK